MIGETPRLQPELAHVVARGRAVSAFFGMSKFISGDFIQTLLVYILTKVFLINLLRSTVR